jgi:hypothetical protein
MRAYSFRFVDTSTDNASSLLSRAGRTHHEGHPGCRIDLIANNLDGNGRLRRENMPQEEGGETRGQFPDAGGGLLKVTRNDRAKTSAFFLELDDRMSSAVNNLSDNEDFTRRYQALLSHYGLVGEKINAREAHENGDVEAAHRHFKGAVEQALLLRGSRDFASRQEYAAFLEEVARQRNRQRQRRFAEEQAVLRPLPVRRLESCKRLRVMVTSGSLIRVQNNIYSVNSRLIGEQV